MKDLVTLGLALLLGAAEATLWVTNPMHIPRRFVPERALGVQVFKEPGASMEPAVRPGEHVLISAWAYWKAKPHVGDIVAFPDPPHPGLVDLKRIVAAGGSTVAMRDGTMYVNGHPDPEPYVQGRARAAAPAQEMPARRVPPGSYFVMGDNRDQSQDSRDYGPIAGSRILGRLWSWPPGSAVRAGPGED